MAILSSAMAGAGSDLPPVRPDHPRLGLLPGGTPGGRTVAAVRVFYEKDADFQSYFGPALEQVEEALTTAESDARLSSSPNTFAACWVATGDDRFAEAAIERLLDSTISLTHSSGYYSNAWRFALAYDWLYNHPAMSEERRDRIEERIAAALQEELVELDTGYPAMWHGRNQLANNTLVTALALSRHPQATELQGRAMKHFAEAVRALAMTEGWPEGPSYWIHNRAFPYALAADCFMTATGRDMIDGTSIREAMRQIAYWQLYAMRPDGTMVRSGDAWAVGPSRNRGMWQPVQDYYARLAGDPGLVAASDYFRTLTDRHYHRRAEAWTAVLAYDPDLPVSADYDRSHPEVYLNAHLARARVFGRHSMGQAFFIERWGDPDAAWVSFKAGDILAHHGHYDQGSFTIFRGSPLAVKSGYYADYFSDYRVGYYVQTIATNSLLVEAPGEFSAYGRRHGYFDHLAGGQRVVIPTGCDIPSVNEWLRNQHTGIHYEAGDILSFEGAGEGFAYVAADITAAYNSTRYAEPGNAAKVSSVVRKAAYLWEPNALVVFDRVVTTDPSYSAQWLLHTPAKPETETEALLEGESADDGVLGTSDRWSRSSYEKGTLVHQVLLPGSPRILKIGGPRHRHWVTMEGQGKDLAPDRPQADLDPSYGLWRTEVTDTAEEQEHLFLNILWPRLTGQEDPPAARLVPAESPVRAVAVGDWVVVFATEGRVDSPVTYDAPEGTAHHLIVDLSPQSMWKVEGLGGAPRLSTGDEGVVSFDAGGGTIRLVEVPARGGEGHM